VIGKREKYVAVVEVRRLKHESCVLVDGIVRQLLHRPAINVCLYRWRREGISPTGCCRSHCCSRYSSFELHTRRRYSPPRAGVALIARVARVASASTPVAKPLAHFELRTPEASKGPKMTQPLSVHSASVIASSIEIAHAAAHHHEPRNVRPDRACSPGDYCRS